jgi:hypothetical protein
LTLTLSFSLGSLRWFNHNQQQSLILGDLWWFHTKKLLHTVLSPLLGSSHAGHTQPHGICVVSSGSTGGLMAAGGFKLHILNIFETIPNTNKNDINI